MVVKLTSTKVPVPTKDKHDATALIKQIRAEQHRIARHEGNVVGSLIKLGELLIKLQAQSGRTWTKRVEKLGYSPRAASRLQKLGSKWGPEIGTGGSDLLHQMPSDLQKLVWLCQLSQEQLQTLHGKINLKKTSRSIVIAEVKSILGIETAKKKADGEEVLTRAFKKLESIIQQRYDSAPDETTRTCLSDTILIRLKGLKERFAQQLTSSQPLEKVSA
jgi:hypothetical protein